jgi:hypothetical protein
VDRLVIVAPLRAGASDEARKLIENGPPFDSAELGFERHGVYLSGDEAVFVFEGAHAKEAIDQLLEEDSMAGAFARWRALLEGAPRLAREEYFWQRAGG